ncbi:MAG: hypothetical protein M3O35_06555 [Acidobacteriota bacterium]|nr:hypothetical protein [Acidobacteriota bacterium]
MVTLIHIPPRIMAVALLCILPAAALAQPPGPNYTADMPSVERVKAEIQGSNPTDTLARQVAVFTYLSTYIQRIKYNRTIDGPYTPEEQRVMGAYDLAKYQITQDYAKSHTPAENQAFTRLEGHYEFDIAFNQDWNKRLMGPQSKAAYKRTESELGARQASHVDSIKRANEEARKAPATADRTADPTAVATRRCLELGGTSTACLSKGFKSGLSSLIGMVGINLDAMEGPRKAGLVLSGRFRDPRALASLNFGTNTATIGGCGKLVEEGRGYSITKGPNSLVVTVSNEPHPLVLTTRADGGLSGPGLVDVKGSVIVGYHTETSTLYRNGSPVVDASCGGVCSKSVNVPDYASKIERCTIGPLNPPPPVPAASTSTGIDTGLVGLLVGVADAVGPPPLPGLRMTGKYGSSGLLFEFSENSVILDCGQAHARQPYTVENTPADVRIHIQNSGGPFTLTLSPNNTLRGSGSATVNGRLVTGMQGDNVTYAPRSESCEIGTFAPAGESPAPSAPPTPTAGSARLIVSSAFPAGANPLAGTTIFLYKDSLANVLRKAGASVAPGATAGEAVRATVMACKPPADCSALAAAMEPLVAARGVIDSTGRAAITPPVPPGRYYVSVTARNGNSVLVWDIKVDLKPGDNSVVLEQSNAEIVR